MAILTVPSISSTSSVVLSTSRFTAPSGESGEPLCSRCFAVHVHAPGLLCWCSYVNSSSHALACVAGSDDSDGEETCSRPAGAQLLPWALAAPGFGSADEKWQPGTLESQLQTCVCLYWHSCLPTASSASHLPARPCYKPCQTWLHSLLLQ